VRAATSASRARKRLGDHRPRPAGPAFRASNSTACAILRRGFAGPAGEECSSRPAPLRRGQALSSGCSPDASGGTAAISLPAIASTPTTTRVGALTDRLALTTGPQRQAAHKESDSPHQDQETERHADPMQDIVTGEMALLAERSRSMSVAAGPFRARALMGRPALKSSRARRNEFPRR
jgi:hypothetical protein